MNHQYLRLLGKKWTVSILLELERYHMLRFNQLKENLGSISSATLSTVLKELQAYGLVKLRLVEEHLTPTYSLTDMGSSIIHELVKSRLFTSSSKTHKVIKLDKSTEKKIKKFQESHFKKNDGESIDFSTAAENLIKKGLDRAGIKSLTISTVSLAGLAVFCFNHFIEILAFCEMFH